MAEEVDDQIVEQLRALVRVSRSVAHRHVLAHEGMSSAMAAMLGVLTREGAMRLTALAERQAVDTSVASRQVAELVELGFVQRLPDPDDARAQLLAVTDAGTAKAERVRRRHVEVVAQVLDRWSEADKAVLVAGLTRLNADLRDAVCEHATPAAAPAPSVVTPVPSSKLATT
ncbi:MarR family winged helix-turn-helix transcriptional regulator [Phytoactinopolyspora endophytica]|uniref:MarR family winged helix-turn-helix transcriptional regulator n=1 Tax=Phytoactinopolyspora endophytica TaxID=1642495 RepID=UPI0013EBE03B|nr:MarR family transcriptional regulator [Phytoactinopolyspora endophytica]